MDQEYSPIRKNQEMRNKEFEVNERFALDVWDKSVKNLFS